MQNNYKTVKIFTMKQEFPCGPNASCCGPFGQSEEKMISLKSVIEKNLDVNVEIVDIKNTKNLEQSQKILELIRSFGIGATPIIAVGDKVACVGQTDNIDEVLSDIKRKL